MPFTRSVSNEANLWGFIIATLALARSPNTFILFTHCVIDDDIWIKYTAVFLSLGNIRILQWSFQHEAATLHRSGVHHFDLMSLKFVIFFFSSDSLLKTHLLLQNTETFEGNYTLKYREMRNQWLWNYCFKHFMWVWLI